ncbi:MAG TPA: sigma-70 family RNA polymerase sigma factor [Candidatus Kapabacteria bacterium]|jgi:RNA polymerase sigma factor (sigma-70 family)|nr:sigma-70 family RNA polymerase sigma factor [Candidatus Kapabacteria bacterium]
MEPHCLNTLPLDGPSIINRQIILPCALIFADWRRERNQLKRRLRPRFLGASNEEIEDAISAAIELLLTKSLLFSTANEVRAWLFTSSLYCLMNERRKLRKHTTLDEALNLPCEEDAARTLELRDFLDVMLDILSNEDRELLLAKYRDGESIAEFARMHGLSQERLHKRQQRALKKVQSRIKKIR